MFLKIHPELENNDTQYIINFYIKNYKDEIYKMPQDFDYKMYKKIYSDISKFSDNEIDFHYLKYGIKEGRIYKIPDDFDYNIYKSIYTDLKNLSDEELKNDYLTRLVKDKRIYKRYRIII